MNTLPQEAAPPTATSGKPRATENRVLGLVSGELKALEDRLKERMESPVGPIPSVGEHLLGAGGKRLRPLLALLASRATDTPLDLAIAVGVAGELIHTATLYHDDVVDDGRVRRGRPAARMVYGNGIVVLVGDFCLARALETVAATGNLAVVQSLAATVTEMAEGEVAQLEGAGNPDATVADYFQIIDRKTASLIAWCARVGGGMAGSVEKSLESYGRAVGRAFQIADDILDCAADETMAGKSVGHDIREGKMTLPVLLGCDADPGLRSEIRAELGEHGMSEGAGARILKRVREAGGVDRARAAARALVETAIAHLGALPPSVYRDALRDVASLSVERTS